MTKMLNVVADELSCGPHGLSQAHVSAGAGNIEIRMRSADRVASYATLAILELSNGEATRLHGDLHRVLGLGKPTVEYEEKTLLDIVGETLLAQPAVDIALRPGVQLDRVLEVPVNLDFLDTLRYVGMNYEYDITIEAQTIPVFTDGRETSSVTKGFHIIIRSGR